MDTKVYKQSVIPSHRENKGKMDTKYYLLHYILKFVVIPLSCQSMSCVGKLHFLIACAYSIGEIPIHMNYLLSWNLILCLLDSDFEKIGTSPPNNSQSKGTSYLIASWDVNNALYSIDLC